MRDVQASDIIFGILYASAAIMLFIASYVLYIKRFKRNKLRAVNEVTLTTSRYDTYKGKTQFLIELAQNTFVTLALLDQNEKELEIIVKADLYGGENVVDFDPTHLADGIYYLSLKTDGTSILRKITIAKA